MRRLLLLLILHLLIGVSAKATHMSGGEIYWDCIGTNQFRVTMVIYRDCFGIAVDPSYNLVLTSPCGNRNLTVSTPGGVEISQLCDTQLPNSTCNGGTLPGIQQYIYTGTITLPPCDSWTISYTNIYRNAAVANLTNPGQQRTYIRAVMNTAQSPCNDSPQFSNTAIPYVCAGYPVSYSFGAFDTEADSLSYQLIPAMGTNGAPLNYVNPHSGAQPIPGLTLDPVTGQVDFTLNTIGNWVVVVQVNHWVDGQIVGHIIRDMQFVSYPCDNIPPDPATGLVADLTGTATQTGPRAIEVCESGDMCFTMEISDPDVTNVLTAFSNVQQNLPGSTFSYSGSNPITATICWSALPGSSGYFPFFVNVSDGACPIPAFQTYVYAVRVLPGLTATLEVVDENCLGTADGSISADISAGTAPYSYTWSNGSTEASISGGAGDYSVIIEDSNGCISHPLEATISTTGLPNAANAGGDLNGCVGVPLSLQGTVQNATGGVWSGGSGSFGSNGLAAQYTPSQADLLAGGTNLVFTTTGNSTCPPASDTLFVAMANSFEDAVVVATDATCYNTANGSASFSPQIGGFTYLWSDPSAQTTATATGLAAGDYTVTVTDALGCSITLSATVGPQNPLSLADLLSTNEGCLGEGNGTATASAQGGTAPYTFTWSTGDTGPSITATSGSYTVSVTDANGCAPASGSITISAQGEPNVANAGPNVVACLSNLPVQLVGTVTNASSGVWSGGAGTFSGSGLSVSYSPTNAEIHAGHVELVLSTTGNTVCAAASDTVMVTLGNSFLNASVSSVNATCSENADGSASFSPDLAGNSYLWNDASAQTTATATGLPSGNLQVIVSDILGCDTTLNVTIYAPVSVSIAELTSTDEGCFGEGNGTVSASAQGGTAPYIYTWNTGDTGASITATSGTYSVSVMDANGCTAATGTASIAAQGQPNEANAGADMIACLGELPIVLTGTVTNATGGVWSGGNGSLSGSGLTVSYMPTPQEIQAGVVELTLSSTGNSVCADASDVVQVQISNAFLNAAVSSIDATCSDASNGSATFSPAGAGLSYLWNDPAAQTTATATGLSAGSYTVVVSDALGCDTAMSALIGPPGPVTIADLISTDETCFGDSNGTASVTVTGGTAPYSYLWSNGATTASITATSGSYTVSVTDVNGCTPATGAVSIVPQGLPNTANAGPDLIGCLNSLPVSLTGTVGNASGGIWSGGSGTFLGSGTTVQYMPSPGEVQAGSVQLTLSTTGNTACPPASDQVQITLSNAFLQANVSAVGASCNGLQNGTAIFTPNSSALSYLWNDPAAQSTATAIDLPAGTYTVLVTDALGCDSNFVATIVQPATLVSTVTGSNVTCHSGNNGTAQVQITGGTAPYTVQWSNGLPGASIVGLPAGSYTANITDAQGCSVSSAQSITQPPAITLVANAPDTVCVSTLVDLSANAAGGTGALTISWGGLGTGPNLQTSFNTSTIVLVSVMDAVGCAGPMLNIPIHVLDLASAQLHTYGDTTVCPGGSGVVGATVSGYAGAYTMVWPQLGAFGNGPFTVPITTNMDLDVHVSDACTNSLEGVVALRLDTPIAVQLPPLIAEGCAPLTVQMPNLGLPNGYSYLWTLGNGNTSTELSPSLIYNAGNYTVQVVASTALGCSADGIASGSVIAHQPPNAAFSASLWTTDVANGNIVFTNQSSGSITTNDWQFGDGGTSSISSPVYTFTTVGTFDVELWVMDQNGCVDSVSHPITITPVYDITFPTAFTPDPNGGSGGAWDPNDLSNDVFYPFADDVDDFKMRIFNRWGELIFESDDIRRGWDGYYRGALSPQDVYVVQTWFRFVDGKVIEKLNDLTLLR